MSFLLHNVCRTWHSSPSARLGHVCSCLFIWNAEWVCHILNGWPHDHGPTNVRAMKKEQLIRHMEEYSTSRGWRFIALLPLYSTTALHWTQHCISALHYHTLKTSFTFIFKMLYSPQTLHSPYILVAIYFKQTKLIQMLFDGVRRCQMMSGRIQMVSGGIRWGHTAVRSINGNFKVAAAVTNMKQKLVNWPNNKCKEFSNHVFWWEIQCAYLTKPV